MELDEWTRCHWTQFVYVEGLGGYFETNLVSAYPSTEEEVTDDD